MPLVYRPHSEETTTHESALVPTDADDSIVLSDLVRTGETSRLRRRGAMRLDYTHRVSNRRDSYASSLPPWDSRENGDSDEETLRREWDTVSEPVQDEEPKFYTLYCGREEESDSEDDMFPQSSSYRPSPLPLYPDTNEAPRPRRRESRKRSNGCGALLHANATPRRRCGVWTAKSDASDVVVSLDESYFDKGTRSLMILRSGCGCLKEGIGCAVCGNILGTRYRTCQSAAEAFSPITAEPSQSLRPEGPDYLSPRQPSSSASPGYVYTFFADHVSSSPAYEFPPRTVVTPPPLSASPDRFYVPGVEEPVMYPLPPQGYITPPDQTSPIPWPLARPHYIPGRGPRSVTPVFRIPDSPTSTASASLEDRVGSMPEAMVSRFRLTADESEEGAPDRDPGDTYDSDGELIGGEPSSPDKSATDLPLWGGR